MDWHDIFGPSHGQDLSSAQMVARGVAIFIYGLILIRFAGHRIFGKMGAFDIVMSVMVGANLSRALTGAAALVPTLAATTALVALHWLLSHLSVHSHVMGWLIKGRAFRLVKDGRIDENAMSRHGISHGDLESAMREKGIDNLSQCEEAWLERNGDISIVKKRA